MKVIILAGGRGTRLGHLTVDVPKPMVHIGDYPIIEHIANIYRRHGQFMFIAATGYLSKVISDYYAESWRGEDMIVAYTGEDTQTGGRIKRMSHFVNKERFMFTYGDGLANVDIADLLKVHHESGALCTVTAVRPPARFGRLRFDKSGAVIKFAEKNQVDEGWINGGFFVCEPEVLDYIDGDDSAFEGKPMLDMVRDGRLFAYKHEGWWACMDTQRDVDSLNQIWKDGAKW